MSNRARKARKRAGLPFTKPRKRPTGYRPGEPRGLGLVTSQEIITAALMRPAARVRLDAYDPAQERRARRAYRRLTAWDSLLTAWRDARRPR